MWLCLQNEENGQPKHVFSYLIPSSQANLELKLLGRMQLVCQILVSISGLQYCLPFCSTDCQLSPTFTSEDLGG